MEMEREDPVSSRDLLILAGVIICLIGGCQVARRILTPAPTFIRIESVPTGQGPCRIDVWVAGKPGDHLFRLGDYGRSGKKWIAGVAILSKDRASVDLPTTLRTGRGECEIRRYHLIVDGQEVDNLDVTD